MTDLAFTPALEQAKLVRSKEVSPVELAELYLQRIEKLNPTLNAFITVASDFALARAKQAEKEVGKDNLPPFHGVPIAVKDLSDTAGIRTTHGTATWSDRVPDTDANVVTKIKEAGFTILGKTNTPEFGLLNITEPPAYGPCRNPWDTDRTTGGSSGGAGAAVASGMAPIATGSDAGGSIRIPSSCCGLYGIKPSRGRVSAYPQPQSRMWQDGPMARTVSDAAALLDALQGYVTGDAFWAPPFERPLLEEVGRDPGRLRIAVMTKHPVEGVPVAPGNLEAAAKGAELLTSLGHDVFDATFDWGEDQTAASMSVFCGELAARDDLPPDDTLDWFVLAMLEMGRSVDRDTYIRSSDAQYDWCRRMMREFESFDILLTPTIGSPPPPIGALTGLGSVMDAMPILLGFTPFTGLANATGQPAVSLPLHTDELGLPVGVQLVGRPADEATLVRVSAQIEAAQPWADKRPPVS